MMIRICDVCKKPVFDGMTDECGTFYAHEHCFETYMNNTYGKNKWMALGHGAEDGLGSYYIVSADGDKGYEGTGIFYIEWKEEGRYDAMLGPNTKQFWIYDNKNDTYIDPPTTVLDEADKIRYKDGCETADSYTQKSNPILCTDFRLLLFHSRALSSDRYDFRL